MKILRSTSAVVSLLLSTQDVALLLSILEVQLFQQQVP